MELDFKVNIVIPLFAFYFVLFIFSIYPEVLEGWRPVFF